MEKLFKCFSLKLEKYFEENGFKPINQREDLKQPDRYVWLFINNDKLQEAFTRYKNNKFNK
jgi:hypothetical protein